MLRVIDTSSAQGAIDTSILDCDVVFVKVSEGTDYINPWCNSQVAGALQGNKKLGLYHFASVGDPIAQARYFYENAKNYFTENHAVPILDYEFDAANQGVNWALRFLDEIARLTGASPIIYMSKEVTNRAGYDWTPVSNKYALWGAEYANMAPTYGFNFYPWDSPEAWGSWGEPTIFQYTSNGHLNGYNGDLDLSIAYLDADSFDKFTNGKNEVPEPVIPEPAKTQASINGIYYVDQVVFFNKKWYVVNNDISVKPIDYNNYIPVQSIVMVDKYGNKLEDQNTVNDGMFFTFGEPDQNTFYEIRYLSDKFISTTMNGEPVWFNREALGNNLVLK